MLCWAVAVAGFALVVAAVNETLNDDPQIELRLRVQPADGGPALEITSKLTVSRLSVPRPGDRYLVRYDPANPSRLAFAGSASMVDQA